jgi:hypothetical protein
MIDLCPEAGQLSELSMRPPHPDCSSCNNGSSSKDGYCCKEKADFKGPLYFRKLQNFGFPFSEGDSE